MNECHGEGVILNASQRNCKSSRNFLSHKNRRIFLFIVQHGTWLLTGWFVGWTFKNHSPEIILGNCIGNSTKKSSIENHPLKKHCSFSKSPFFPQKNLLASRKSARQWNHCPRSLCQGETWPEGRGRKPVFQPLPRRSRGKKPGRLGDFSKSHVEWKKLEAKKMMTPKKNK